jgi:hypothetical protein
MFHSRSNDSAIVIDPVANVLGDFTTTRFLKRKPHTSTNAAGVPAGAAVKTFAARLKSRSFKAKLLRKATPKSHTVFRRSHIHEDDANQPEVLQIVARVEPGARVDAIASQLQEQRQPTVRRLSAHRPPFRRSQVPKPKPEQEITLLPQRKKPGARRMSAHRPPFRRSQVPKIQKFTEVTSAEFDDLFNAHKRRSSVIAMS